MGIDMTKLHPRLQEKAGELLRLCGENGIPIRFTQGYRSSKEQDELYALGRTKPGKKVTNARGGYSMHNWGVAIDFCRNDGKGPYEDADGFFSQVGAIAKGIGLEWGGDWKSIVDKPHVQLPDWGSGTATLRSRYGTPEKFMATWGAATGTSKTAQTLPKSSGIEEDVKMTTIKKGSRGKAVKLWQVIIDTTADGVFGSGTESKTKAFQKDHGLTADGVVGSKSWKAGLESV